MAITGVINAQIIALKYLLVCLSVARKVSRSPYIRRAIPKRNMPKPAKWLCVVVLANSWPMHIVDA